VIRRREEDGDSQWILAAYKSIGAGGKARGCRRACRTVCFRFGGRGAWSSLGAPVSNGTKATKLQRTKAPSPHPPPAGAIAGSHHTDLNLSYVAAGRRERAAGKLGTSLTTEESVRSALRRAATAALPKRRAR